MENIKIENLTPEELKALDQMPEPQRGYISTLSVEAQKAALKQSSQNLYPWLAINKGLTGDEISVFCKRAPSNDVLVNLPYDRLKPVLALSEENYKIWKDIQRKIMTYKKRCAELNAKLDCEASGMSTDKLIEANAIIKANEEKIIEYEANLNAILACKPTDRTARATAVEPAARNGVVNIRNLKKGKDYSDAKKRKYPNDN